MAKAQAEHDARRRAEDAANQAAAAEAAETAQAAVLTAEQQAVERAGDGA
jgi:hypothetical protein